MFHQVYSDSHTGFWRFFSETRILACERVGQAVTRLLWLVEAHGAQNPLIITDPGVRGTRFFNGLILNEAWPVFEVGVEGEDTPLAAILCSEAAKGSDLLIAIGGGSVLDAAKCLAACVSNNLEIETLPHQMRLAHPPSSLICVPTTFGTGSEVNMYTHLVTDGKKHSFRRHWLTPSAALLVGEAGMEMPERLKYLTGVDAWVHAFEALTLARERSPIQDALLKESQRLHDAHFQAWLNHPSPTHGLAMATASCLGGLGIHNARTGLIHALAAPFAARFKLPHQISLLPFIEPAIGYNQPSLDYSADDFKRFMDGVRASVLGRADAFQQNWKKDLKEGDLQEMAAQCALDRVLFKENPHPLDEAAILELYKQALL